jgi:glycerophosphoryl diester phosphodiesterase
MAYPRIIAHRGGGGLAPENSLAGLAAAASIGCRGVEFDTMLSADGVPVLMHDDTVDRTTGGSGAVSRLTFAELRQLDIGGEPVPSLAEALVRCAELGVWANIELKVAVDADIAALGQSVGRVLAEDWNGDGVISSYSTVALLAAKSQLSRDADYALLVDDLRPDWRERAVEAGACAVHMAAGWADAAAIAAVRAAGLELACYTVNEHTEGERLLAAGATAVFTDFPELWHSPGLMPEAMQILTLSPAV